MGTEQDNPGCYFHTYIEGRRVRCGFIAKYDEYGHPWCSMHWPSHSKLPSSDEMALLQLRRDAAAWRSIKHAASKWKGGIDGIAEAILECGLPSVATILENAERISTGQDPIPKEQQ